MKNTYAKYLSSLLLFGTNGIVASFILLPSLQIVLVRTSLGMLLLLCVVLLQRRCLPHVRGKNLGLVLGSGVAMGVCWVFVYLAYREIGVGLASLLYALGPVLVMATSPLLFGERLTGPVVLGFLVVLSGSFLVNGGALQGGASWMGIVHGIFSAFAYACMIVFCKKAKADDGLGCTLLQLVAATATAMCAILITGTPLEPITADSLLPALVLGFANTGLGCYLYFSSIGSLRAQTVTVCDNLETLTAVVLSALVLGEALSATQCLGAAMVILGAVFCEVAQKGRLPHVALRISDPLN